MRSELGLFEEARRPAPAAVDYAMRSARRIGRSRPLTVVDVALRARDHRRGTREYIGAKRDYARDSGAFVHHAVIPGTRERHGAGVHELPALGGILRAARRSAPALRGLDRTLREIGPDLVLLHEPDGDRPALERMSERAGARLVGVGGGQRGSIPLRRGLHRAFHPGRHASRRRHVLYAGSLDHGKGIPNLLDATALTHGAWPLRIVGAGPEHNRLRRQVQRLGLTRHVAFLPYVRDRERLARMYAEASCVVVPGEAETYGLVALEAAACGTPVVCCDTAPVVEALGELAETFTPGDIPALAAAIDRARARSIDPLAAARLVAGYSWERVLQAELRDLDALA